MDGTEVANVTEVILNPFFEGMLLGIIGFVLGYIVLTFLAWGE